MSANELTGRGPTGLIRQLSRFGIVGLLATTTHVLVFVLLIELLDQHPLMAQPLAWLIAFGVSFSGHYFWTFSEARQYHGRTFAKCAPRFLATSLFGLLLNTLVVWLVVNVLARPYEIAVVLMVTFVPGVLFVVSKLWVFARPHFSPAS